MRPEQPLTTEGEYLLYMLKVSEGGAMPHWRTQLMGDMTWMERQERAALYALGRMRESLVHRMKRLPPDSEQQAFLFKILLQCQGEDGRAQAPRWPASNLGAIVGMIRHRLFVSNARAA